MSNSPLAPYTSWQALPMPPEVTLALERLRRAPAVQRIAVMPDVHAAGDVCVGMVVATSHLIYPQAVGGDIGCGMLAVALDADSSALASARTAGQILAELGRAIPAHRRNRRATLPQPVALTAHALSHPPLAALARSTGTLEFATLGSGNHFIELQADTDDRLWLMVHSGSRALGPAIRDHHLTHATPVGGGLYALKATTDAGLAYTNDAAYARLYADASRRAMAEQVGEVIHRTMGASLNWSTLITTDHNHVAQETHFATPLWVHRKGAMRAQLGEQGVLPGSMGSPSYHVAGCGHAPALCSSAHGAGRVMSRTVARQRVTLKDLHRQMSGIWFDPRLADQLRDEAPVAYKDIRAVLRAQREMVKVIRTLRPILNYKGV